MSGWYHLKYNQLRLQKYLKDETLSLSEKQLVFKLRSRMVEVGHNFGKKNECPLCMNEDDKQNHLMECVIIKVSSKKVFNNEKAKYEDIFGHNVKKIKQIVEIMEDALRCRELLLEN